MASRHDTGRRSRRTERVWGRGDSALLLARPTGRSTSHASGATRACEGTSHASLRLGSLGITLLGPRICPCWMALPIPTSRYRRQRCEPKRARMEKLPVDRASAPPNRRREELTSTHQLLLAQSMRHRYLAAKARREASAVSGDPIAPRLIELAEKLEGDAVCAEEEARILLAEQGKATPPSQLDKDAGGSSAAMTRPALGIHAQGN